MKIIMNKTIKGSILDIGGGGEVIIGRIYQSQVTAIDNRQEELDEVPEGFSKLLMDACNLKFEDNIFDNVSLFYTLMYIDKNKHNKVIKEASRVLKKGGELYIWDTNINQANPFLVELNIDIGDSIVNTTYGVYKDNAFQDKDYYKSICEELGFYLIAESLDNDQFYMHLKK
ncbi:MAG: class I SAM-dependent methyltransferase [Tissierellia bacterium]|nr:class I SAM-dependent methyltransferase [Tissierellia bacterium]